MRWVNASMSTGMRTPTLLPIPFALVLLAFSLFGQTLVQADVRVVAQMREAALEFIESLDSSQKSSALMELDSEERENWKYVPADRKGVVFKDLNEDQLRLAKKLLAVSTSVDGLAKSNQIIELEHVLFIKEGRSHRDRELYYVSIFGDPAKDRNWGWRFEGHHLSLNFTVAGDQVVATPAFMGANPAEVRIEHDLKGLRVLGHEEDLARGFVESLRPELRKKAIFADEAIREIITKAERSVGPLDSVGVSYADLSANERAALMAVIFEYLNNMPEPVARARRDKILDAGLGTIQFGWAGSLDAGERHYYRIQGPTFLIEYTNFQNQGNHIHCVWRDFDGDFGRDLLREHLEHGHRH